MWAGCSLSDFKQEYTVFAFTLLLYVLRSKMALTLVSSNKCAGGFQKVFEHERCDTSSDTPLASPSVTFSCV